MTDTTDLDDLRARLDRLGNPPPGRPPDDIYAAARTRRRPAAPRRLVAAAAVLVLVGGAALWVTSLPPSTSDVTARSPEWPWAPADLPVPGGDVVAVTVAFDRAWVASAGDGIPGATTVHVFEVPSGRPLGTVSTASGDALVGSALALATTDHHLWVRTTSNGPVIADGMTNVVYRIDPGTLRAEPVRHLLGDGPLVGHGDRIVAADWEHLEVVAEDGAVLGAPSIDAILGLSPATLPGTNGLLWLHLDANGLWAVHQGRGLLLRLDPTDGALVDSVVVSPEAATGPPPTDDVWWFPPVGPWVEQGNGIVSLPGARLDVGTASLVAAGAPGRLNVVASLADGRALVQGPDGHGLLDPASDDLTPAPGPPHDLKALVEVTGEPHIASWPLQDGDTRVTLWPVPPR